MKIFEVFFSFSLYDFLKKTKPLVIKTIIKYNLQTWFNHFSICGLSQLLTILHSVGQVSDQIVEEVKEFIKQNSFSPEPCVAQKEENSNSIPSKKAKKVIIKVQFLPWLVAAVFFSLLVKSASS